MIDLTDIPTRQEIEDRHVELLLGHELQHLDLHEITTSRRAITQTIAADLFDRGAGAVQGTASLAGDPIALTDPAPEPLTSVTTPWGLALQPASEGVRNR